MRVNLHDHQTRLPPTRTTATKRPAPPTLLAYSHQQRRRYRSFRFTMHAKRRSCPKRITFLRITRKNHSIDTIYYIRVYTGPPRGARSWNLRVATKLRCRRQPTTGFSRSAAKRRASHPVVLVRDTRWRPDPKTSFCVVVTMIEVATRRRSGQKTKERNDDDDTFHGTRNGMYRARRKRRTDPDRSQQRTDWSAAALGL